MVGNIDLNYYQNDRWV